MRPGDGLVLALDQGSHASRAVLFDSAGDQLAAAQVPVATRREGTDRVEQDPWELVRSLQTSLADVTESRPGAAILAPEMGSATARRSQLAGMSTVTLAGSPPKLRSSTSRSRPC